MLPRDLRLPALLLLVCATLGAGSGCRGSNGDPSGADTAATDVPSDTLDDLADAPSDPTDADATAWAPAFPQPTGLAVVGRDEQGAAVVFCAVAGATDGFGQFPLDDTGGPAPSLPVPVIARISREGVKPFSSLTVEGTGFTTHPDAAISVVFEAEGLAPVAVPVLIATDTTLQLAAPVLLGDDGLDARGEASVRVVQVLGDNHTTSAAFGRITIERLPPIEGENRPPAGVLTATFLQAASEYAYRSILGSERPLPGEFMANATRLRAELGALSSIVGAAARGNPSAPLPWTGGETPTLDVATLDLMDRLVFASLRVAISDIQADAEAADRAGVPEEKSAPYGCPELEGTPEQQLESMLCMHHGHPAAMARVGEPAVAAGFQVVSSVYLGFWGGSAAAVLAARSRQLALAFEVVWAGTTGHLTAWMTGRQRPSAGQTLSDSGATLADRLLRAGGSLDTMWTAISFGRTFDALVREAAATGGGGDTGVDAGFDTGPDVADARADSDEDTTPSGSRRYEGEATLYGDEMVWYIEEETCLVTPRVDLQVVVTRFGGDGTSGDPYRGDVEVTGALIVTTAPCAGSAAFLPVTGRIGGLQGEVGFDLESSVPPRYQITLSNGRVEAPNRTLTGDIVVEFWPEGVFWFAVDGVIELDEVD